MSQCGGQFWMSLDTALRWLRRAHGPSVHRELFLILGQRSIGASSLTVDDGHNVTGKASNLGHLIRGFPLINV